jgi:hypothetical protein
MKRIQAACLNQTIHFLLKDDVPRDEATKGVKAEFEAYKKKLEHSRTVYKILDEQAQADGSIIVKIKKQINQYDVGGYLD